MSVFGGGALGATPLFQYISNTENGAAYLIGLGIGFIAGISGLFYPRSPLTRDKVKLIIDLDDALQEKIPDADERTSLIFALVEKQKATEASALNKAADTLAKTEENNEEGADSS